MLAARSAAHVSHQAAVALLAEAAALHDVHAAADRVRASRALHRDDRQGRAALFVAFHFNHLRLAR